MKLLILFFLYFSSPSDTCKTDSLNPNFHHVICMKISKMEYVCPCKWTCSCSTSVIHYGWLVRYEGKEYHVEGKRKDGKKNHTIFTDYTE